MSIETTLADLTTAIKDLTEAIKAERPGTYERVIVARAAQDPKEDQVPAPKVQSPQAAPEGASTSPVEGDDVESYENVKEAVLNLVKAKGNAAARSVLGRFGAKNAKEIPADRRVEFLEAIFGEMPA